MPVLRQMRYFVAVADAGQVTAAASRLGISQPTLSQALAQLEGQLGVQLLERMPGGVNLTNAGRVLLEKARATIEAADAAIETAAAVGRAGALQLAVGFHWTPLGRWAPMFQKLLVEHPGAQLEWHPLEFPCAGRLPIAGVDVGILYQPPAHPDLASIVLDEEPRVVLMSVSHRLAGRSELTVAEVLEETFPGPDKAIDPAWRAFWTLDAERGGPAPVTDDRVSGVPSGAEVVAAGRGIAITTASLAGALAHPGMIGIPLVDARPATLALVWRRDADGPLVESLLTIAREMTETDRPAPQTREVSA
jgi:DNA-binding transcriptional LysR family regulator